MTEYKCYECEKTVGDHHLRHHVRCPYCGSKMLFKQRMTATHVKAR